MDEPYGMAAANGAQRITIANRLPEIAAVSNALDALARTRRLPDSVTWRFHLALEELLRNIVAHAFPDKAEHRIEVTLECDGTHLIAQLADDGIPFNPLHVKPPDLSGALEGRKIDGVGIHLARNVVDTLDYAWKAGKNVVTVRSSLERRRAKRTGAAP